MTSLTSTKPHAVEDGEKFSKAIDAILDTVDSDYFPTSVDTDDSIHCVLADAGASFDVLISEALETSQGRLASKSFYKVRRKIDRLVPEIKEIEGVVIEMCIAAEFVPLAVGYAAGLRNAGASREAARTMLRGLLRHFRR